MPGLGITLGRGGATTPQWDLANSDCIVIQGSDMAECGDLLIPMKEGRFGQEHFADEIGEVAAGKKPGRTSPDQITIYKSVGIAIEDVAAANLVLQRARAQGVGTQVEL